MKQFSLPTSVGSEDKILRGETKMGKDVLLLGIGQMGCTVAELFSEKLNKGKIRATSFAIDTDEAVLDRVSSAIAVPMTDEGDLFSVVEALGAENVKEWFPCEWDTDYTEFAKTLSMRNGANQWRMKALLSFASFLSKENLLKKFTASLDAFIENTEKTKKESRSVEIYTVASLAGGTGSALFLPIALYVKKYLKDKGIDISCSRAMLVMPSVFESCYSAEQRVKSNANAYAALREYNALATCTGKAEGENSADRHPPIVFKIGNGKGSFETLFDSEREEYRTPEAAPFDKVYLFERIPSVTSVAQHADTVSDIISIQTQYGDSAQNEVGQNDSFVCAASLVRVVRPTESIAKYLVKRQLSELAMKEISFTYRLLDDEIKRRCKEAQTYGGRFVNNAESYAETVLDVAERVLEAKGTALAFIGREASDEEKNSGGENAFVGSLVDRLDSVIDLELENASIKKLRAALDDPEPDTGKQKIFNRPKTLDKAIQCGEWLRAYYKNGLDVISDGEEDFVRSLKKKGGDFSLTDVIFADDGKFVHPAFALLRLCQLYNELRARYKAMALHYDDAPEALDGELLCVPELERPRTKYAKAGENRFSLIINKANKKARALADDSDLFYSDLKCVISRITDVFRSQRYSALLDVLSALILDYRSLFSELYALCDDVSSDVRLSLLGKSEDNGLQINLGASVEEKEKLYSEYAAEYLQNEKIVSQYTEELGRLIYRTVNEKKEEALYSEMALELSSAFERIYEKQLCSSDFYKEKLSKNLLSFLLASSPSVKARAFKGRGTALRTKMSYDYAEYCMVKTQTEVFIDSSIKKFIENKANGFSPKTAEAVIEELMFAAGEYAGVVRFVDNLGENSLLLLSHTENLRPHFVCEIDEMSEDGMGYRSYVKARNYALKHKTQMWNPHLVCSRNADEMLPFISPGKQLDYEMDTVKAVTVAIAARELILKNTEQNKAYFLCSLGEEEIVCDACPDELLLWAYRHPLWVKARAEEYDKRLTEEARRVPVGAISGSDYAAASRVICATETFLNVREALLPLLSEQVKSESPLLCGYALRLSGVMQNTLFALCRGEAGSREQSFIELYNRLVGIIADALISKNGEEVAADVMKWLNSFGFLKIFDVSGEQLDYDVSQR